MGASQKKVVVRRLDGELLWGYLPASGLLSAGGIEVLGVDGRARILVLSEIRTIAYVRDFNLDDRLDPERIGKLAFAGRPRGEGLWLRLSIDGGLTIEGLANFDMGFIDALLEDRGLFLTVPDPKSNVLRLFVPRSSLKTIELLGLITSPSRRAASRPTPKAELARLQAELFGDGGASDVR